MQAERMLDRPAEYGVNAIALVRFGFERLAKPPSTALACGNAMNS
jgi:hypothetical protein